MSDNSLKIFFYYCANSLAPEAIRAGLSEQGRDMLKIISLPCSGKLELIYLLKSFETGADGVVLVTCRKGECRHLEGNLRAGKRAEAVDVFLEEIGLGRGRMMLIRKDAEESIEQIIRKIDDFSARIKDMKHGT